MAETFNIDELLSKYSVGSSNNPAWMAKIIPSRNDPTSTTELSVDNYYNFYGIQNPKVDVYFLKDKGSDLNGADAKWTNINGDEKVRQNNYFVNATITDNGSRTLNLTLFDRSFYQVQGLIFQAIKAGGGKSDIVSTDSQTIDIKNPEGDKITSLNFVYQPNNMIVNNIKIKWGYSDENPSTDATIRTTNTNYFSDMRSDIYKNVGRWNERKGFDSQVLKTKGENVDIKREKGKDGNEIVARGSYEEVLNQWNQSTIRSSEENFFITNVTSTLTETGMRYDITAIGVDNFILNGFKFVQMYAQIQGTAKEIMGFFMKSFNENNNSLIRVVWADKNYKLQNGTEYVKNYDGKYVVREEAEEEGKSDAYKRKSNLNKIHSILKNTMAVLRRDDSQTLGEDFFNKNEIEYSTFAKKLDEGHWEEVVLSEQNDFISVISTFLGGKEKDGKERKDFKEAEQIENQQWKKIFVKKVSEYYNKVLTTDITKDNNKNSGGDKKTYIPLKDLQKIYLMAIEGSVSEISNFSPAAEENLSSLQQDLKNLENYINEENIIKDQLSNLDNKLITSNWEEIYEKNDYKNIKKRILDVIDGIYDIGLRNKIEDNDTSHENVYREFRRSKDLAAIISNKSKQAAVNYLGGILEEEKEDVNKDKNKNLWRLLSLDYDENSTTSKIENFEEFSNTYKNFTRTESELKIDEVSKYNNNINIDKYKQIKSFCDKIYNKYMQEEYARNNFKDCHYGECWKYTNNELIFNKNGGVGYKTLRDIIKNNFSYINVHGTELGDEYIVYIKYKLYDLYNGESRNNDGNEIKIKGEVDYYKNILTKNLDDYINNYLKPQLKENIEKNGGKTLIGRVKKFILEPIKEQFRNPNISTNWNKLTITGSTGVYNNKDLAKETQNIFKEAWDISELGNEKEYKEKVAELEKRYDGLMKCINDEITKNQETIAELENGNNKGLITLTLGGEEAKNNYAENSSANKIYYKTISSLFSSFVAQCPPYTTHNDIDNNGEVQAATYNTVDADGNEVVNNIETNDESYTLGWSVIGLDGAKPIIGFYYKRPKKIEKIRVYNWGNGNAKQHAVKNLSIQTSSEFGMLNMAAVINKDNGSATSNKNNITYNTSEVASFFSGGSAFVSNVVNNNEEMSQLVDKMTNGIKQGFIEVLGDPSLRFQGEFTPYTYPIKIDVKLQKDGAWSEKNSYIPCQLTDYYVISKITHNISSSGYTTTLEVMSYPGLKDAAIA